MPDYKRRATNYKGRARTNYNQRRAARFAGNGTCSICGRPLSDRDSVIRGMGPECERKIGLGPRRTLGGRGVPHMRANDVMSRQKSSPGVEPNLNSRGLDFRNILLRSVGREVVKTAVVGATCVALPVACPAIGLISKAGSLMDISLQVMRNYHSMNSGTKGFRQLLTETENLPASQGLSAAIADTIYQKMPMTNLINRGPVGEIAKGTIKSIVRGAATSLLSFAVGG